MLLVAEHESIAVWDVKSQPLYEHFRSALLHQLSKQRQHSHDGDAKLQQLRRCFDDANLRPLTLKEMEFRHSQEVLYMVLPSPLPLNV